VNTIGPVARGGPPADRPAHAFGRIRHAEFALLATFDHPHFRLVLAGLSELTLARLDRCFDGPIPDSGRPPRASWT
jgi:hypothetical protein